MSPKHTCVICGKICRTPSELQIHCLRKHSHCQICDLVFENKEICQDHMDSKHPEKAHLNLRKFFCIKCDSNFETESAFGTHRRLSMNLDTLFDCACCDKKFCTWQALKIHLKSGIHAKPGQKLTKIKNEKANDKNSKKKCRFCKKAFNKSLKLRNHYVKNHNFCKPCKLQLGSRKEMNLHIKEKHPESVIEFDCKFCEQKFDSKTNLTIHEKNRKSDVLFNCNICPYSNCLERGFFQHLKTKHHFCTSCKQAFETENLKNEHLCNRYYSCQFCDSRFSRKEQATAHMKRFKNEIKQCKFCPAKFCQNLGLFNHVTREHSEKVQKGHEMIPKID